VNVVASFSKEKIVRTPDYPSADAKRWNRVDSYFADLLAPDDEILTDALSANAAAGLPTHDVSALQGQLLALLVQITNAQHVLEIGTLGGYSTIRLARALSQRGRITTIEADEHHAAIARENIKRAGLQDRIDLRVGPALDILPTLVGPFDLIFIDADKPNNPSYIRWALNLSRTGTVIVGDNVVRGGAVADPTSTDLNVRGVREFLSIIAAEPRLTATAIQTVGEKGWDGFVLARVGDE
jgi:predicted O-methyltransferase YrrM